MAGGERMSSLSTGSRRAQGGGTILIFGARVGSHKVNCIGPPPRACTLKTTQIQPQNPRKNSRTNTRNTSTVETKSLSPSALPLD